MYEIIKRVSHSLHQSGKIPVFLWIPIVGSSENQIHKHDGKGTKACIKIFTESTVSHKGSIPNTAVNTFVF